MSQNKPSLPKSEESETVRKESRSAVSMHRWLRLTARKHSAAKTAANDSSKAAAEALTAMLGQSRRLG